MSRLLCYVVIRGIERSEIFPGKEGREDFIDCLEKSVEVNAYQPSESKE